MKAKDHRRRATVQNSGPIRTHGQAWPHPPLVGGVGDPTRETMRCVEGIEIERFQLSKTGITERGRFPDEHDRRDILTPD